ncbi:MAG: glycosyltransferase family 4 protein [Planctomycetota bacterium]|nr:glycosyltransferase family 4 protein [Planctomycetaceae bacterium]MDQ3332006.1 glycosyltransferase family 4 protein [Planctomycetota bacterium]
MPRVALLFEYPTLLGGERSLLASVERLPQHQFLAFAPQAGPLADALREHGIECFPSPLFEENGERLPRPLAASRLIDAVQSCGADLLHGNSLAMGRLTGAVASGLSVPCTAHLRDIIGLSKTAIADLNGNARLLAVSDATRAFHVAQGLDQNRTVVVYNGVDLDRFRPGRRAPHIRRELGIPEDALAALTVGQIGLRKGWDVLAEAIGLLSEAWPALHVLLVGERYATKAETVEYERSVRAKFDKVLPGRAHFLGSRSDMPELMSAADLLVHPARQEPFGRVLLEAAASGLPIVATNVGGTPEMVEDGVSARLVPPGDATSFAQAIADLLSDADQRARLGHAARRTVEARFPAETAARALAKDWHSVLSEPRPSGSAGQLETA